MSPIPVASTILRPFPWRKNEIIPLLLIGLIGLAALRAFWSPGISSQADFLMGLYRVRELADSWREGIYFARLGLGLNFGYTAPLFQFYPPLASYLALPLVWLGLGDIAATKSIFTLAAILGGVGVYVYARRLFANVTAATTSAALYVLAPYLLTVVYERGALAESVALALAPWLVWASHSLMSERRRRYFLSTAAFTALFVLAHNITAFFVFPAAVLYVSSLALIGRRPRSLIPLAAALALGLGLSAFYWLPALGELSFTHADRTMLGAGLQAADHLVSWQEVVQKTLVHLYTGEERFHFSLLYLVLGLMGLAALILKRRERPYTLWLIASGWLVVLLLQVHSSAFFWENLPLARYIQFPWRLYGVGSFCVVLLAGVPFTLRPLTGRTGVFIAAGLVMLAFWLNTANLRPELLPIWYDVSDAGVNQADMWERGRAGFPLFSDYTPAGMQIETQTLAQGRTPSDPSRLPPTTLPGFSIVEENPLRLTLDVTAEKPWTLRLHRIFFPGWEVFVDGAPVPTEPGGAAGLVTAELPSGGYRVVAEFGDSPVRLVANLLSLSCLAIWLSLLLSMPRAWLQLASAGAIFLILLGVIWLLQGPGRIVRTPTAFPVQFDDKIHLLAFHLPEGGACASGSLPLRLYWAVGQTPAVDYKVFLHLAHLDDSAVVAQVDTAPFGGFNPMTRWEAGELVTDEIAVPVDGAPPGRYMLLAGLYHPETVQNLRVIQAPAVLPGDRLKLAEIDVCDAVDR